MSTELQVINLQNELKLERQRAEIMELKYQLQKTQAEKASRLDDSLLSPHLYEHYQKVAVMLSKSGVIPNIYKGKPEDIFVAMSMGYQLGFPVEQSLQDIAVVNGRPCLWGDGLLSLALNHPECQSIDEQPLHDKDGRIIGYSCTVIRQGHKPHTKQFTLQDAQLAGLLSRGTVWKSYPERMLQMRARSFAIRDKFADALRGLRIAEIEQEDSIVIDSEPTEVKIIGETQVEKLKSVLKEKNNHVEGYIVGDMPIESSSVEHSGVLAPATDTGANGNEGSSTGIDNLRIRLEQIDRIEELFIEKDFNDERITKAFGYYKVTKADELSYKDAEDFIKQLEKAQ